ICGVVGEFVRRFFPWWREGKAAIAPQRIGRTTRVKEVASGLRLRWRPIAFLVIRVRAHDKNARGPIGGKLVLHPLEEVVVRANPDSTAQVGLWHRLRREARRN